MKQESPSAGWIGTEIAVSGSMENHVYKSIEVTGTSDVSMEDAVKRAIQRASKSVHNMRWFSTTEVRGSIEGSDVQQWQVTVKIGFTVDD